MLKIAMKDKKFKSRIQKHNQSQIAEHTGTQIQEYYNEKDRNYEKGNEATNKRQEFENQPTANSQWQGREDCW